MEKLIEMYREVFPHTTFADWFYAFVGLFVHVIVKIRHIPYKHFKLKFFLKQFLPVWYFSLATLFILIGTLPEVMSNYNVLDSALIGYSSSSLFKQLLKSRNPADRIPR